MARSIGAIAVIAALLAAATAGARAVIEGGSAQAGGAPKYDFRISPRVGTPATTFRVTFNAPFPADGTRTEYIVEGVGPRGCVALYEVASGRIRRGDRVVLTLTADDDFYFRGHQSWCRGSYIGYVWHSSPQVERVIGHFSFGVGRSPVSLEP
jgi:hypothetical protein